jgi:flagellar hook protein FlgE
MSLTGALSSAISALSAQSQSLAMISDNIANSQTAGYKTNTAMFEDLVTGSSSASSYASGGVIANTRANITQQGLLTATTNPTDVGIQGNGFFPVTTSLTGGATMYTRDGAFTPDKNGFLENNGAFLLGWPTDASGNVIGGATSGNMVPINTQIKPTEGSATTETTFALNLPSDAAANATFTSSMSVYDSLGNANSVQVTWTKTATNSWTASFGAPTLASDSSVTTGTAPTGGPVTLTFNSDGSLATPTTAPQITIPWTNGASTTNNTVTLNLSAVTQTASGATTPAIDVTSINSDGVAQGKLSSVSVGTSNGDVNATYSNGQTITIYKIPVATFTAPDALQAQSGGLYAATVASGAANTHLSGQDGAGTVMGSELESSTADTNTEFSSMISAQQAYSAASQVVTAVNKMFDTLISSMR